MHKSSINTSIEPDVYSNIWDVGAILSAFNLKQPLLNTFIHCLIIIVIVSCSLSYWFDCFVPLPPKT